ncbi:B3 domain-containing protein REM19-like [Humulus lupulus]|uniref:B3 domain-containing protein REM19-like n=1 Tax=Humulus lupulus TaxID=3486 RepID=UPI002B4064B3|nr:B3 domain-containing protein REM19-like [Humulus lupulus]
MTKESRSSKVESCSTMKEQALERASCPQTKRPSFTVTMRVVYTTGRCNFCLPYKFVEKYISKKECEVRLWVLDGRSWFVQLRMRQRNVLPRAELLSHGWKAFALDNSLRAGDICTFELPNNGNEISFKVSIVKIADDACNKQVANKRRTTTPSKRKRNPCVKVESSFNYDKANMIPQNLIAKIEQEKIKVEPSDSFMKLTSEANTGNQGTCKRPSSSGLSRASEAASQFFSKNPYFQVILRSNHVLGCVLHIPCTFGVHYFEEKTQTEMLWVGEKYWYVKLLAYKSDYKFSVGWAAFAKGNSLQPRDVCISELIKRNQSEMKVYIFRQSGLAQE